MPAKIVEFLFDPISPYVWLAWTQRERLRGCTIQPVPVLFAGLLDAHGTKGPAEVPAKRRYTVIDVMRWAAFYGLEHKGPPTHPFNSLKALRLCVAAPDLTGAVIEAAWARGLDISDDAVLAQLAAGNKRDGGALLASAASEAVKAALRANTERAAALGVFGVPTFVVDGELFWGHDRMTLLQQHLDGDLALDHDEVKDRLARPASAQRKNAGV